MSDVKTALRKARAVKVAEFRLKQRLEMIEWEDTELKPYLDEEARRIGTTLEVPHFDFEDTD